VAILQSQVKCSIQIVLRRFVFILILKAVSSTSNNPITYNRINRKKES